MKPSRKNTISGKSAAVTPHLSLVPSNVVSLQAVRAERIERAKVCPLTVQSCRELLEHALAGQIQGLAYVVNYAGDRHEPGVTGGYITDPVLLMGAIQKLARAADVLDEASLL